MQDEYFTKIELAKKYCLDSASLEEELKKKEGEHDKSQNFGFNFPDGTWCIGMKVDNEEVWQSIKQGDVKGFSLEGFFTELSDEYLAEQEIEKIMRELTTELNS